MRTAFLVLLAVLLGASTTHAQAGKRQLSGTPAEITLAASARGFFSQGLAYADQENWVNAADRFRRAMEIRNSPVLAFNLAAVLDELGEVVEAAELLHQVEERAGHDSPLAEQARQALPAIERKFSALTVELDGPSQGATILLDGELLIEVQVGAPIPVDPGAHQVQVLRNGRIVDSRKVEIPVAKEASVQLKTFYVPTPEEVALAAAMNERRQVPIAPPPMTQRWWFWASLGAVTVGILTAATIMTLGGGSSSDTGSTTSGLALAN